MLVRHMTHPCETQAREAQEALSGLLLSPRGS